MRTLVDQVRENVDKWLDRLDLQDKVAVAVLIGGDADRDWARKPEQDAILIGTQDMLLSRALNRGYGLFPTAWPIEFGLLNNDCFWVVDEVQLMDNGLPTSLQLESLRRKIGTYGRCHTMWMSATVNKSNLATVDFDEDEHVLLSAAKPNTRVTMAKKTLSKLDGVEAKGESYSTSDARKILECHKGKLTLIIVNRVSRAQSLYLSIKRLVDDKTEVVLVHSRFRPSERRELNRILASTVDDPDRGIIIVSTQAVEAGVDISSHTMITELAPITSMVQRFGRCNRRGEHKHDAQIFWIDAGKSDTAPYEDSAVKESRDWISQLPPAPDHHVPKKVHNQPSASLSKAAEESAKRSTYPRSASPNDLEYTHPSKLHDTVLRRSDLLPCSIRLPICREATLTYRGLYVTGMPKPTCSVYWRNLPKNGKPDKAMAKHSHDEVCAVPIGAFKKFVARPKSVVWHYEHAGEDYSENPWIRISAADVRPGQIFLVGTDSGGYSDKLGWYPDEKASREVPPPEKQQTAKRGAWCSSHITQRTFRSRLKIW